MNSGQERDSQPPSCPEFITLSNHSEHDRTAQFVRMAVIVKWPFAARAVFAVVHFYFNSP